MDLNRRTRQGRSRYTLVLLVLTSVTLLTLDFRGFGPLESARNGVLGFFAPVGEAAESVFSPVASAWNGAFGYGDLERENEELRQRVMDLEGAAADQISVDDSLKLGVYANFLVVSHSPHDFTLDFCQLMPAKEAGKVNAEVVSSGVGNFDATIEINRGSNDGIAKDQPVVASGGLIGQVVRVSDTRSAIRLVTDPKFQVGVRVASRPGLGIATGQGDETRLAATSFDLTTEIEVGDHLVTSGAARSPFPPDIPVGVVTEVISDEANLQKNAEVEIIPRLNDLLYVTVIRWEPQEPRWEDQP